MGGGGGGETRDWDEGWRGEGCGEYAPPVTNASGVHSSATTLRVCPNSGFTNSNPFSREYSHTWHPPPIQTQPHTHARPALGCTLHAGCPMLDTAAEHAALPCMRSHEGAHLCKLVCGPTEQELAVQRHWKRQRAARWSHNAYEEAHMSVQFLIHSWATMVVRAKKAAPASRETADSGGKQWQSAAGRCGWGGCGGLAGPPPPDTHVPATHSTQSTCASQVNFWNMPSPIS